MEKESTLALFHQLESDVKTCLEKDLDTNEELKKQKSFQNNFAAMLDFLVKLKAPSGIQNEIKEILKIIGEWDVYAYWFKEMKDLVAKIKAFMSDFTSFAESSGLIPKDQKPAEKVVALPTERPGMQPPAKPVVPSLLKPIMGAGLQKPVAPSMPPVASSTKPPADTEETPVVVAKERTTPLLKPVFKTPPVKMPAPEKVSPAPPNLAIDESSAPVPLKSLVGDKKLEIHVKPVKLIKPILAVKPAATPTAEGSPKKVEPPVKPTVPTLGSRPPIAAMPKVATPLPPKQTVAEKSMLVPKPFKIVVPDLDNINLDEEVNAGEQGIEPSETPPQDSEGDADMFSDMNVIEGSIPVKAPPARIVKPIPVKVQLGKAVAADHNDEVVESVFAKVSQQLDKKKSPAQRAPAPVKKTAPTVDEDEFITPMEVSPEDISEWISEEDQKPDPSLPQAKPGASKKKDVVEMLDAAESWDDEQISSILGEAMDDGTAEPPSNSIGKEKAHGPVTLKHAAKPPVQEKQGEEEGDEGASIGVIDQEPKKARLQNIKKPQPAAEPAEPAEPEPVDSMSLFMGGLGSKRADRNKASSSSNLSLFRHGGMADAPASTAPSGSPTRIQTKQQQPAAPIGSDVDVETLPDTKDGLYQALIALEGKRYAIERARKDLRADLDKGIIKAPAYEGKLVDLKAEMDKIADKIKEIREKIKKFK